MDVGYERDITQSYSQETLRRVKENDESFKCLWIGGGVVHIDRDDEGNEVMKVRFGVKIAVGCSTRVMTKSLPASVNL